MAAFWGITATLIVGFVNPQQRINLNDLIDAIKKSISPSGAIAGPFPVSLVNPSYLDAVSSKLNSFLSEKVTTV